MNWLAAVFIAIVMLVADSIYLLSYFSEDKKIPETLKCAEKKKTIAFLTGSILIYGVLIVVMNVYYNLTLIDQIRLLSLICILIPAAIIDFYKMIIPNKLLIIGLIIRAVVFTAECFIDVKAALSMLKNCAVAAAIMGAFFLLLLLIFRNGIGMGDVKTFALMGLYQGLLGVINSVFFTLLVSFILSVTLLITKKKKMKDTISFGPSILIGTVIGICLSGM